LPENSPCRFWARPHKTLSLLENRIGELETTSTVVRMELSGMQASTSWRLTAGLRRVMIAVRGR
jgi:hypothetical protein